MEQKSQFYGRCTLCDCKYYGSANRSCGCCHAPSHHVLLQGCQAAMCDCEKFESPSGFSQCFNCVHDSSEHGENSGDPVYNQLKVWVSEGVTQRNMLALYQSKFSEAISRSTLQRKLQFYEIKFTQKNLTDEEILQAVRRENQFGVIGYHRMHRLLRTKHGLHVSRDRLYSLMRTDPSIPKGRDPKVAVQGAYHVKPFISEGPNWLWAIDGHEKLAQPFGLYIYGMMDTFSRKILSLEVLPNKKKQTVCKWLLESINVMKGTAKTIMLDKGSEWNDVLPHLPVIQMRSVFNQKIEALWSQLWIQSDIKSYKMVLRQLEQDGKFIYTDEKKRWALFMSFHNALQKSLNQFRENYNMHNIRKQKNVDLPTGYSPSFMYEHPEMFGKENHLQSSEPLEAPIVEDVFIKFPLPDHLFRQAMCADKEDCLSLYSKICEVMD